MDVEEKAFFAAVMHEEAKQRKKAMKKWGDSIGKYTNNHVFDR